MRPAAHHTRSLAPLIIALVLGGCAVAPPPERAAAPSAAERPSEAELVRRAQEYAERGDLEGAARETLSAAARAAPDRRAEYQLQAVALLLRGNFIEQAKRTLLALAEARLHVHQMIHRQLLAARIALAEHDPLRALEALRIDVPPSVPAVLRLEAHELRAEAYYRAGNLVEAARERVLRETLLSATDPAAIRENQQVTWQTLMLLSETALEELRIAPPPDVFSGWLELAHIAKAAQVQPLAVGQRVAAWRARYPTHPAGEEIIALVLARQQEEIRRPEHIAVLLPQSGALAALASALQDGFLAAHFRRKNRDYSPTIRFYDVGSDALDIAAVYARATSDGAEFVVGPLRKETVTALARSGQVSVPTLALNYREDPGPDDPRLYQFGLAPEDEARQLAERAWLDGFNRVIAIVPEGDWGQRVLDAFQSDWVSLGGRLLETQRYTAGDNDFADPLQKLLDIDESIQRRKRLEGALRTDLSFEPRRRQDADLVVMAAFPRQARLIRPQLKFHYAGDLPVYGTSHVFTGTVDRVGDRDMDDVVFCDIPWILSGERESAPMKRSIKELWPEKAEQYARFYALGIDAYNIIPHLNNLRTFSYERFDGETGLLRLAEGNRIVRQLQWAQFRNGVPGPY